ncbi:MAG: matrixin family metalloprotease [Myxococcota bacterium]
MRRAGRLLAWAALALVASGLAACAGLREPAPRAPYVPDRRDYAAFREGHPDVLEPNYLPFMVHRVPQSGGRDDLLILCRWDDDAMPLSVYIREPEIPELLQNEFDPRDRLEYVRGVEQALATWQGHLEGLVRFRRVSDPSKAKLRLTLEGRRAPVPDLDVKVLGSTRIGDACRAGAWDPDAERLEVEYEVSELHIYVADEFGLLAPGQVEWVALHEIGHALGMRGHSPIPADLMYEVVRDRLIVSEGLSTEDVNSFVSLYRLPNGTVYGTVPREGVGARPMLPPTGPVQLALAPWVDPRLGFDVKLPDGWLRIDTGQGMVAVDGVTWDYDASFQVVVSRYDTVDDYLARFGDYYRRRGRLLRFEELVVNGRRAVQGLLVRHPGDSVEEITLIESGDGRVVVVTAECAIDAFQAYSPWFDASLASLRLWEAPGR